MEGYLDKFEEDRKETEANLKRDSKTKPKKKKNSKILIFHDNTKVFKV